MSDFFINKKGFWETSDSSGHVFDKLLVNELIIFFENEKASNIADFGCGMAQYARTLIENGFECDAFDGNPNTVALTNGLGKVLDLSIHFDLNKRYDWILSLEVGEHIPKEFEEIFLDNLTYHAKNGIILSWAVPGQLGDGHVNCKSNHYIIHQLKRRGWQYDEKTARRLKEKSSLGWFKNTIMVFVNKNNQKKLDEKIKSFFISYLIKQIAG